MLPGSSYTFDSDLTLQETLPNQELRVGRARSRQTWMALEQSAQGTLLSVSSEPQGEEGELGPPLAALLARVRPPVMLDFTGASLGEHSTLATDGLATFPEVAVQPGEGWVVQEYDGSETQYMLESVSGTVAEIVAHGVKEHSDGGTTTARTALTFSLLRGRVVKFTTVAETVWPEGHSSRLLVEQRLV